VVALDVPLADVQSYGIVVADDKGQILSFQEKPKPADAKSTLASTGIYIFEPEVLKLIPPGKVYDIGSQLFPQLVENKLPFFAQKRFFNWIDIGRVSDYWTVLQRVLRGEVAQMNMPGVKSAPASGLGSTPTFHGIRSPLRGRSTLAPVCGSSPVPASLARAGSDMAATSALVPG
jgi:mannose-1-phosphate guanylyltransferase